MSEFLVVFLVAFLQASAAGLRREQREKLGAMDENPITITVTQGSTAILPCSVDPIYTEQNKDQYKVVWVSPQQTAISMEDRRIINDMRISVERPFLRDWNLHIRNVSITDAGEFMCQVNTDPVETRKVSLLVNVPPVITEYTQPVEMTRMEGEMVELYCNASGIPTPTVTWYRLNQFGLAGEERVGSSGEHLVIHNVTRMCADVYICRADNGVPFPTSQEFTVDVHYPPEIELHNTRIGQEVGKETILECIISASPLRETKWRRGKQVLGNNLKDKYEVTIYDQNGEPNTIVLSLRIVRVEPDDYGTYTCEASNNFGNVVRLMELYEVRTKPPPTTPTTTTTTTTVSRNVHFHGSGNKKHQPNNNYQGTRYPPGVFVHGQSPENGEDGHPGSTPGPRPLGSEGQSPYKGGNYDPNASEVHDGDGNGSASFQGQCMLVIVCLTSSLWWLTRCIV